MAGVPKSREQQMAAAFDGIYRSERKNGAGILEAGQVALDMLALGANNPESLEKLLNLLSTNTKAPEDTEPQ